MRVFIPCWGEKSFDLLEEALLMSFSWHNNALALKDAVFSVVTDGVEGSVLARNLISAVIPTAQFDNFVCPDLGLPGGDYGIIILKPLLSVIRKCIAEDVPMLMATVDFIYGNGTLKAFDTVCNQPGTCASIAHIRATREILKDLKIVGNIFNSPVWNDELVSAAWRWPHISWTGSEYGVKNCMSYRSGISWQSIERNVVAVQHVMPSPFYCRFLESDLEVLGASYDGRPPGFGSWDHKWAKHLIADGRLRYIGSSDAAVMVEVTDKDKNVPPVDPPGLKTMFFNADTHNRIHKQFISVLRGI
jgi:hypothetical protein